MRFCNLRDRFITEAMDTGARRSFIRMLIDIVVLVLLLSCVDGSSDLAKTMQAVLDRRHPPLFVFGDSLVDVGNNKFVPFSLVRMDFYPNGVDFVDGPTGRFCNGRTVADLLCDQFGIPYPPAAFDPNTAILDVVQKGANFASAAAGILDESGNNLGKHLPMNRQIERFNATVVDLESNFGSAKSAEFLARVLGFVAVGSNDFIDNYWLPGSLTRLLLTPTQFNDLLVHNFGEQLKALYNLGLRHIIVCGLAPLGYIPIELQQAALFGGDLTEKVNAHVREFNLGLRDGLLPHLARVLPQATFLYADVYNTFEFIQENFDSLGLEEFNNTCCQAPLCLPPVPICPNRSTYAFWDAYHPTEAMNILLINRLLNKSILTFEGGMVSRIDPKQYLDLP